MPVHIHNMAIHPLKDQSEYRLVICVDNVFPIRVIHAREMPALVMLHIICKGVIIFKAVTFLFKKITSRAVKNLGEITVNNDRGQ
jgi:hypothetical protein